MEELMNREIKKLIDEYPGVGTILDEYGIGCVPCSVGSCLLKDIMDIHNMDPRSEKEMMEKILKVVFSGRNISVPLRESRRSVDSGELKYSPPMKKLVDEHVLIKRLVALIPAIVDEVDVESEDSRRLVLDVVDFIRSYADKYHHAKEEDILFKYFDHDLDILKVMHQDHETGRAHVRAVVEAVEGKNKAKVAEHLLGYRELLTEHINKEDEILYPWMDRELSDTQIGQMFTRFNEVDTEFGDAPSRYEEFINRLEKEFS